MHDGRTGRAVCRVVVSDVTSQRQLQLIHRVNTALAVLDPRECLYAAGGADPEAAIYARGRSPNGVP